MPGTIGPYKVPVALPAEGLLPRTACPPLSAPPRGSCDARPPVLQIRMRSEAWSDSSLDEADDDVSSTTSANSIEGLRFVPASGSLVLNAFFHSNNFGGYFYKGELQSPHNSIQVDCVRSCHAEQLVL